MAAQRVHLSGALCDLRPVERGRMVQAMGRYLLDHIEDIAPVLTLEQGKPLWESRIEVEGAARYFEYYGNQAETVEGRSIPLGKTILISQPMSRSAYRRRSSLGIIPLK